MQTLGILAFGLGLAFLVAGMVSFALNRGKGGSDENARGQAGETELDLFTTDDIDDEFAEAAIQYSGTTGAEDTVQTAATHTAGNERVGSSDWPRVRSIPG
jgi:hypothetical protein